MQQLLTKSTVDKLIALAAGALLCVASFGGGVCSIAAWNAQSGTADGLERAMIMSPGKADIARRIAFLRPENADEYLQKAVTWDKYDGRSMVEYALLLESRGESTRAENTLLNAYASDIGFRTRWALTNFYFRAGNDTKFWLWASRTAERARGDDRAQLLDLCWRMEPSVTRVLSVVGRTCETQAQLLPVVETQDTVGATSLAESMAHCTDPVSLNTLQAYVDHRLMDGSTDAIVQLWRAMEAARHKTTPSELIANGAFAKSIRGIGFNWHSESNRGIDVAPSPATASLRVEFTGDQNDAAIVLWQPVVLPESGEYQMDFRASANAESPDAWWVLASPGEQAVVQAAERKALVTSPNAAATQSWRFHASEGGLRTLALVYRRSSGSPRFRGLLNIGDVHLRRTGPELVTR